MADTRVDQEALDIYYLNASDKDKLMKTYANMVSLVMARALSVDLKNKDVIGDQIPGGTVTVRRLKTSASQDYGTARTNGYGSKLQNNGVDVKLDTDKEIIEEIKKKDADRYGIPDLIAQRQENHSMQMIADLDQAYFRALQSAATSHSASGSTTEDKVLSLVRALEAVSNDNVNRVDRSLMVLTLAPEWYDELTQYIHSLPNPAGQAGAPQTTLFHGVEVHSAPRQEFDAIVQVRGAVAQPVALDIYQVQRIPFSNDLSVDLFYSYGCKAVMADCIYACALDEDISV